MSKEVDPMMLRKISKDVSKIWVGLKFRIWGLFLGFGTLIHLQHIIILILGKVKDCHKTKVESMIHIQFAKWHNFIY